MGPAISLRDVGVRFRLPRAAGRLGHVPRLIGGTHRTLWALRGVSLAIAHGEVMAVIGPNGSGKTTLLRTIARIYRPDEGDVSVEGAVAPLLSLAAGLKLTLSGWHNVELSAVLLGVPRKRTQELAREIAVFTGLEEFMDAPVRIYSSGMRARLGFAIALFSNPDILVLDEVMAVGDEAFRERSRGRIKEFIASGRTVIVSSHNLDEVAAMSDRVAWLDRGRLVEVGEPRLVSDHYLEEASGRARTREAGSRASYG